jgi:hypothetical protein
LIVLHFCNLLAVQAFQTVQYTANLQDIAPFSAVERLIDCKNTIDFGLIPATGDHRRLPARGALAPERGAVGAFSGLPAETAGS